MKDFLKENSKYKIVAKLSIISVTTLLMMFAGTASIDSHYHSVYAAAKNATSSSSKGGGSSSINSTSPIGSSAFLNVITKVDNINGGMAKPSNFTITISGKSPSPKSFSGSTSGTSVTLKAGKYKVTLVLLVEEYQSNVLYPHRFQRLSLVIVLILLIKQRQLILE